MLLYEDAILVKLSMLIFAKNIFVIWRGLSNVVV